MQRFFLDVLRQAPALPTPILTLISPFDVPLELLPILDEGSSFSAPDAMELEKQAKRCFLGLQFAVRRFRLVDNAVPADLHLRRKGTGRDQQVSVAPYWYEGLKRVKEEVSMLDSLSHYKTSIPEPSRDLLAVPGPEDRIAKMFVLGRQGKEEIVHVTAHCNAPAEISPLEHRIVLGAKVWWGIRMQEVSLSVGALAEAVRPLPGRDTPDGPLAFISACGAANFRFDSPASIPDALLSCGYRAVVSSMVSLHVDPAFAMARAFYSELCKATVGGALVEASSKMIREHCNPIGLTYLCLGESRLRLEEAH